MVGVYFQGLLERRLMLFMKSLSQELHFAALIIVMTISMPGSALGRDHEEFSESVDRIVEPYVEANWFTGTVALYHSDQIVYQTQLRLCRY